MDAIKALKIREIEAFEDFLKRLERGYFDEYDYIMQLIMFIENIDLLDNTDSLFEYYYAL